MGVWHACFRGARQVPLGARPGHLAHSCVALYRPLLNGNHDRGRRSWSLEQSRRRRAMGGNAGVDDRSRAHGPRPHLILRH